MSARGRRLHHVATELYAELAVAGDIAERLVHEPLSCHLERPPHLVERRGRLQGRLDDERARHALVEGKPPRMHHVEARPAKPSLLEREAKGSPRSLRVVDADHDSSHLGQQ